MREAVERFCAAIGSDPLLVQGAGGNASWKEGDTLWVKASGTWLAEALERDIFVSVDLPHLSAAISDGEFAVAPKVAANFALRPSIETILHALMPHPVVVHLHAVDVLAHLVRSSFPGCLEQRLGAGTKWVGVPYRKPGAELARAIAEHMVVSPGIDIVMMQNHGVVIGGENVEDVEDRLAELTAALKLRPLAEYSMQISLPDALAGFYLPVPDAALHQMVFNQALFGRLEHDWSLYPDHVVFLGPRPVCHESVDDFVTAWPDRAQWPDIVFLKNTGVFSRADLSVAKLAQLRCYYDVMVRQKPDEGLNALSPAQTSELLDWDAEKYRMSISR
jgi:rhamnose utilization protein RhaD (predicted bifunctional aldolase and dehydrogenase)